MEKCQKKRIFCNGNCFDFISICVHKTFSMVEQVLYVFLFSTYGRSCFCTYWLAAIDSRGKKAFQKLPFFKQFLNRLTDDSIHPLFFFMFQWPFKVNLDENEKSYFWQLAYSFPDPTLLGICVSVQSRTRIPLCIIKTST